ncbi:MAG: TetR/AcrR family transcriptional regulator [Bacteroidota bacterium]
MSDIELKSRILEVAKEYFFNNGFSKISMDEFAQSMGMSKKTIYKFFPSKDELIREITHGKMTSIHQSCLKWHEDKSIDFMDRIRGITAQVSSEMRSMKPQFYLDLQRTMPDVWKEVDQFRSERILQDFSEMIREGVSLGVFRDDINIEVLVLMYSNAMQSIINPEILAKLPITASQAYEAIIDIVFGGVFTQQAKEKYIHQPSVPMEEKNS